MEGDFNRLVGGILGGYGVAEGMADFLTGYAKYNIALSLVTFFRPRERKSPALQGCTVGFGTRTVLQYLLSPIQKTVHEAGRER